MTISTKDVKLDSEKEKPKRTKKSPATIADAVSQKASEASVIESADPVTAELVKQNITEEALKAMEENFLSLTINGLDDKDGYDAVYKARQLCKNTRILTKKVCEGAREDLIRQQKEIIAKENEVVGRIKKVEDYLSSEEKRIDDEKEAIKQKKLEEEQITLQKRSAEMVGTYGMSFVENAYVLEDIRISVLQVKTLDEFTYGQLMSGVKAKYQEIQDRLAEQKRQEEEVAQRNKELIEAAKKLEEENRLKQDELARKEKELQEREIKMKEEAEAKVKAENDRINQETAAKALAAEQEFKNRKASLFALGYSLNGTNMVFADISISESKVKDCTIAQWPQWLEHATQAITNAKTKIAEDLIAKEKKIADDAAAKALIEKEAKDKADKLEAERLAALKPDSEKLDAYILSLSNVERPVFDTEYYKQYRSYCDDLFNKFVKHIKEKQPK